MLLHESFETIDEWDDYISIIIASELIDNAIIYSKNGRILAQHSEFTLEQEQLKIIMAAFDYPNDFPELPIGSGHYTVVINDGKHGILGRSSFNHVTVCQTERIVLIGFHIQGTQAEQASQVIMGIGDFLYSKGM